MIFEARPDQVTSLSSEQLVALMKRLLLAECRKVGVPLRSATVPLQITIADGGEDGRASWEEGVESTDFFPTRFSVFQAKAQNLTESSITAEIAKRRRRRAPLLNEAVSEVIRRQGAYIVFCSKAFTGPKIAKLCKAIVIGIRSCGKSVPRNFKCDVYDANRIADWVNTHPSVALWLTELGRGRSVAGFQSQDSWEKSPDIYQSKWVADEDPRFAPAAVVIDSSLRKDPLRNAWTFRQAVDNIHSFLAGDGCSLRIAGPSGFGKSRFAFEVFNDHFHIADAIESASLLYADVRIVGKEANKLALEIADAGAPVIMVVDECSDEQHIELMNYSRRVGSRLRVVTIDVETRIAPTANTLVLHLEPASNQTIAAIARGVSPSINDLTTRLIEQFSNGFPRMAVLAAPQGGAGKQAIRSAAEILGRVIWGRRPPDQDALRALEVVSLFEWLGLDGSAGNEATFVAECLAQMSRDAFVERVRSFADRGIVTTKGDFVQIAPPPLAAALGSRRFALLTEERLDTFWAMAPERLKKTLLRRMKWLDGTPAATAFASRVLSPTRLGNVVQFSTDFGADCIDRFVHVAPDITMETIDRVLQGLDAPGLKSLGSGRRHLVWALEKLAFRRESFVRAATHLRRLAATETEPGISNNATGQFQQLFQLHLSGTEVPPEIRLLILDDGLCSADENEREVCVGALDRMLATHHFSRGGGAEQVGSQAPMEDWFPKSHLEVEAHLLAAVARLKEIALRADDPLANRAKGILASHVRGLINHLPSTEIRSMVVAVSQGHVWTDAIHGVNSWLFFDSSNAPAAVRSDVRNLFVELLPADKVDLALLYSNSWPTDLYDPDHTYARPDGNDRDFEYIQTQLVSLAEEIAVSSTLIAKAVKAFACATTKSAYPFAKRLAEKVPNATKVFNQAVAFAERGEGTANQQFFSGLVSGIEARDPKSARNCIRTALRSNALKDNAIALIGAGKLRTEDMDLVAAMVEAGEVAPRQCIPLSYGGRMAHLRPDDLGPLLDVLCDAGSDGIWAALEIVVMFLHGGQPLNKALAERVRGALLSPRLFESTRAIVDAHHFEKLIEILARQRYLTKRHVRGITKQVIRLLHKENSDAFRAIGDSTRPVLLSLIHVDDKEVWHELKAATEGDDWYVQHRLNDLVSAADNDKLAAGPLFQLRSDLYLQWAREQPEKRARWIMKWLPVATKDEAGNLGWHSALLDFVTEFHACAGVLAELSSRMYPSSWWGPIGQHLQPAIDLLTLWKTHPLPELRDFAQVRIQRFGQEIADGLRRHEQDEVIQFS